MRNFRKMHGLGNDFVIIDARDDHWVPTPAIIRRIADRRRGVGCDQLVLLLPPTAPGADLLIRFFNADGTESGACGNASRCVARLLFEKTGRGEGVLQTPAGLLPVWRAGTDRGGENLYAVDLATPEFDWDKIPLAHSQDTLRLDLSVGVLSAPCAVNVGNPHAVFFVPNVDAIDLVSLGPQIERHQLFPQRVNVEICEVLAPDRLRLRVWERGVGITPACGSGAVATAVAAARRGLVERRVNVVLDGCELQVEWRANNRAILIGSASALFTGQLSAESLGEPS